MRTLTLDEASSFLRLAPQEIMYKVEIGLLPGATLNNELLFIDTDLADYVRGYYHPAITKNINPQDFIQFNVSHEKQHTLFSELIPHMLRIEENRVRRGELSQKSLSITRNRLAKWITPYFNDIQINEIGYVVLEAFIEGLSEAEINGAAITQYLIIIRKVLNYALLTNLITSLPHFPKVKAPRTSRGAFTITMYRLLLKTAWRMRDALYMMQNGPKEIHLNEVSVMDVKMPRDMTRLIGFMVNSFIRPSDLKFIQHKHVEIINGDYLYLRLSLPENKKHNQPIVTLTAGVGIYKRLLLDAQSRGYGKPNDYLFLPEMAKRRDHALRYLGFLFSWILDKANLKIGPKGQTRTLYCLRHTSITFRLLYGEGVDLLTLAKNARTSVNMIEKHYASTLNGEMNVGLLHSKRVRKSNTINNKKR
ncbi:MAG: phage integrase SAM-like domain-containing protein [Methylophilaceae bacterium]|nr:phage integrase SAM-like domain-containing protein [Methylophilaceae bacterium]